MKRQEEYTLQAGEHALSARAIVQTRITQLKRELPHHLRHTHS